MKKIRLFLLALLMGITLNSRAQGYTAPDTQRDYYMYSCIEVRWANKANGEQCFVILITPGDNAQQRSSILKNDNGKAVVVRNMMEGLAYLQVHGWEILQPRENIGKWIVRKKVSFENLKKLVDSTTTYEAITPKVQLTLNEKTLKVDYE